MATGANSLVQRGSHEKSLGSSCRSPQYSTVTAQYSIVTDKQASVGCSVRIEAMATVKVNKRITDTIRELNGSRSKEIRLGAVARKLSELEVEKALELLNEVPDTNADPTKHLLQALVC